MDGRLVSAPGSALNTLTGPDTLDQIQATLERFWARHSRLPETARRTLGQAAREIGGDIVDRAGTGWPVRMGMAIRWFPNLVQMNFTDDGRAADAAALRLPAVRLHYHRNGFGNHWTVLLRTL